MTSDDSNASPENSMKELRAELLEEIRKSKIKDTWDKFGTASPFLTALLVAILGAFFTHVQSNRDAVLKEQEDRRLNAQKEQEYARQRESQQQAAQLQKLQTIGQFMPYLTSTDERKQHVAITAIRSLAGIELAIELAKTNDSPGARQALAALARTSDNPKDRAAAQTALNELRGNVLVTPEGECGPGGSGGDEIANQLKNRQEIPSQYRTMSVNEIQALEEPEAPPGRQNWATSLKDQIKQLGEGQAISTAGYIVKASRSSAETANCRFRGTEDVNWHLRIADTPNEPQGLFAVVNPRTRVAHRSWSFDRFRRLADEHARIRVSGWLLYMPEQRSMLGRALSTLWRIQPVTKIEVFQNNGWVSLDDIQ